MNMTIPHVGDKRAFVHMISGTKSSSAEDKLTDMRNKGFFVEYRPQEMVKAAARLAAGDDPSKISMSNLSGQRLPTKFFLMGPFGTMSSHSRYHFSYF